ncbi:hypothetical protein H920_14113 [Fukomys damarensis]|uniref:Uncharacterized protein n=1 Tax=Fukomys damarensis TaxID=885580 RepID=A0A091CXF9_FUKDA|nr:hypothetical protein H920_14113 [Fukomys damarensis]
MRTKTCHVKGEDPNDECNCAVYLKCTNKLNEKKNDELEFFLSNDSKACAQHRSVCDKGHKTLKHKIQAPSLSSQTLFIEPTCGPQQLAPKQGLKYTGKLLKLRVRIPIMGNLLSQEQLAQDTLVKGPHAVKASKAFPAQTQASIGPPEHSEDGRQKPLKNRWTGVLSLLLSFSPKASAPPAGLLLPVDDVPPPKPLLTGIMVIWKSPSFQVQDGGLHPVGCHLTDPVDLLPPRL